MPRVSIGLPVYNAAAYLEEALNSLLAQTYEDFELIISDNASTDKTQDICKEYSAKDTRIKYFRNDKNLGAAINFNRVFELSTGEYFKWAAHDDICTPEYLIKCVKVLDNDKGVVLAYPKAKIISEDGKFVENYRYNAKLKVHSLTPQERFRDHIMITHWCFHVFGLTRSHVLKKTPLIGNYSGSDRVLLAELSLHGRFHEIDEYLFIQRQRSPQRMFPNRRSRMTWFDPTKKNQTVFPEWRVFSEFCNAIRRAPLNRNESFNCYLLTINWMLKKRKKLVKDILRGLHMYSSENKLD